MKEEARFAEQLAQDLSPADVRHVLAVFAADLARLTGSLAAMAALNEADAFRRAAHALAGAAGAVGASVLEEACRGAMADLAGDDVRLSAQLARIQAAAAATERDMAGFLSAMDIAGG
jgi:HPt (histidine-containing phosphotransfer) domain-containing protein